MASTFTYKNLEAWTLGVDLVERCYRVTSTFPTSERYGIASQMRRAAISIPSNVAEGHCRRTTRAFVNHINIALGSHGELETCAEIAFRLGFLGRSEMDDFLHMTDSVGRLLNGLRRSLERKALP